MKLKLKDKVLVISGKDKGKKGKIVAVIPKENKVIVENINISKKHLKPNQKNPKGGIVEVTKPIAANKVMVIDPSSGRAARIGYKTGSKKQKERIFKVPKFKNKKLVSGKKNDK